MTSRSLLLTSLLIVIAIVVAGIVLTQRGGQEDVTIAEVVEELEENLPAPQEVAQTTESSRDDRVAQHVDVDPPIETVDPSSQIEDEKEDLIRLHGNVLDANTAQPVPGAKVAFLDGDSVLTGGGNEEMSILTETTTDEVGFWELEVPRDKVSREVWTGAVHTIVSLKASAPDYATSIRTTHQEGHFAGDSKRMELLLDSAGTIAGRVVDESGDGIGGASVGWQTLGAFGGGQGSRFSSSRTVTDGNGSFELTGLPSGQRINFPVLADGFIPKTSQHYQVGERDARITLKRGTGVIHGHFFNTDGSPVIGGHVQLVRVSELGRPSPFMIAVARFAGRTDNEGAFRFENLAGDNYRLIGSKGKPSTMAIYGSPASDTIHRTVDLREGGEKEVDLRFADPIQISGRVVDKESRHGVAGVLISPSYYTPGMARPDGAVTTGADGSFSVEIQQPTSFTSLFMSMPEGWVHAPATPYDTHNRVGVQMPESQAPDPITIEAQKGILVRGRVVENDGETPVLEARPLVSLPGGGGARTIDPTDGAGEFRIYVSPRDTFAVRVHAPNGYAEANVAVGDEAPAPIVLRLEDYAGISGYVRDMDGNPVEGIGISAMHATLIIDGNVRARSGIGPVMQTNDSGYYYIDNVPPVEVTVGVRQESLAGRFSPPPSRSLEMQAGEYRRDVDFVLHESLPIEGMVVDEEGTPLPNVTVNAYNMESLEGHFNERVTTNDEGVFELVGVPERARLSLSALLDGYIQNTHGAHSVDDFPLVIQMRRAGSLMLRVVDDQTGEPVTHYLYKVGHPSLIRYSPAVIHAVRDPKGETAITNQSPGAEVAIHVQDVLRVGMVGTRRGVGVANVPEGDEGGVVEVRVRKTGSIEGTVHQPDEHGNRTPAQGVEVIAKPVDLRNIPSQVHIYSMGDWRQLAFAPPRIITETDGRFALKGLEDGDYIIEARRDSPGAHGSAEVSITHGADVTGVDIDIKSGATLHVVLLDHEGEPIPNVPIVQRSFSQVSRMLTSHQMEETDAEGRATFKGLLPGSNSIKPQHELYDVDRNVELDVDTEETEVILDFTGMIKLTGVMTTNGHPFPQMERLMFMDGEVNARVKSFRRNREQYSLWIPPGDYRLATFRSPAGQVRLATFTVDPSPIEQEKDFRIEEATGHVVLVFPSNDDFEPGVVTISRSDGSEGYHGIAASVNISSDNAAIPSLPVERLRATFRANSGKWHGVSDWVDVTREGENMFVIDLDDQETFRIGQWSQEVLTDDYSDLVMNVTAHLNRPGPWEVLFDYQSGNEGLMIESVALLANGAVIDIDIHPGWSGFTRHDHIYTLNVPEIEPGFVYQVVASIHAGQNQDSHGVVWLRR